LRRFSRWVLGFGVWGFPGKHAKGYPFAVLANRKAADYVGFRLWRKHGVLLINGDNVCFFNGEI
jgi:hypothetical protein